MERTARIERTGGPEVIEWHDVALAPPGPGEVRMRNTAVGLTSHRRLSSLGPVSGGAAQRAGRRGGGPGRSSAASARA